MTMAEPSTPSIPSERIAVVGDSALRTGFRLAGVTHLHQAATPAEAEEVLGRLMSDSTMGIIIVEERLLESIDWRLKKKIESAAKPVVVAVPGRSGPLEQGESIAKLVKRALGFDLMKKGKNGNGNGKNGNGNGHGNGSNGNGANTNGSNGNGGSHGADGKTS
ncbi:V-type ATP synthase subunit F [uncultured archaeon]|nr:V-type ATP synthase subunit F [uncultured archaeon]